MYLNGVYHSEANYAVVKHGVSYHKYPVLAVTSLDNTPLPPPNGWYLDVIAGTNPSRPVLNPPELLQDLIDIPRDLFEAGKLLRKYNAKSLNSKDFADGFLGVKFGWLPLIEDLRQLLDLQLYILKRNQELDKLYSRKGLRRRLKFSDTTLNEAKSTVADGAYSSSYLELHYDVFVKKKSWATIHWKPLTPPPWDHQDLARNKFVRNLVLGLTPEGITKGVWNVIPWTWLLGWFTNVGKYALAFSNTVPATHSEACFMSESSRYAVPVNTKQVLLHDCNVTFEGFDTCTTKQRTVSGSVTPGFNMPYLDMSRLSVLGALAVQRIKRR